MRNRFNVLSMLALCGLVYIFAQRPTASADGPTKSLADQFERTPLVSLDEVRQVVQLDVVGSLGLGNQYTTPLEREAFMETDEGRARKKELAQKRAAFKRTGIAMETELKVSHYYLKDRSFYVTTGSRTALSAGELHCLQEGEDSRDYACFPRAPFLWGTQSVVGIPFEAMFLAVPMPKARAVSIEPRREGLDVYVIYEPHSVREVYMGPSGSLWSHDNIMGRLRQILLVDGDEIVHRRKL